MSTNRLETYAYQASKSAIIHLTRRLALELAPNGIAVSALAPGHFPSWMNRAARDQGDLIAATVPARRLGGPSDIGGAAVFLAAAAGDYVVGSTLVVDGGADICR